MNTVNGEYPTATLRLRGSACAEKPERRPIRVLELRAAEGAGGGPEKTILLGAARSDPDRFAVTACYIRTEADKSYEIDDRATRLGVDYCEIAQRGMVDISAWGALRRLVRERRFDIVHAHDYKTDLLALLLARHEKVAPLSTAHGWTGHSWKERLLYYPIDKRLLARFPRVVAVSSEIRQELVRVGVRPERVTTILNGIDHRRFHREPSRVDRARQALNIRPGEVVLGAMGRLEPQKRFDLLLEAFARLSARRRNMRLLIAGEGSLRDDLERMARQLEIHAICCFLGHQGDVAEFHHGIDIFVQSSQYEGTPNVVLEAMAFETPVVATSAGGTGEVLTDHVHGRIVPVGDVPAMVLAIEQTISDPVATGKQVRNARRRVEGELSFETRMRKVEAIYDELAKRGCRLTCT